MSIYWKLKAVGLGMAVLIIAGCRPTGNSPAAETSLPRELTPYPTASRPTEESGHLELDTPTPQPLPTPTHFIYTIVQNDTLIGIAARFSTSVDALILANPQVNPNILSVGTELLIPPPSGEDQEGGPSQPTPVGMIESPPRCYPTPSGGLWCFWLLENPYEFELENLSALISLYDSQGEKTASQAAIPPLNLVPPGSALPLAAYFEPPVPKYKDLQAQLVSAIEVLGGETRYLPASVGEFAVTFDESGLSGQVSGRVDFIQAGHPAAVVWVAAAAFDSDGEVVGVRRWEGVAAAGQGQIPFTLLVASLGPPIAYVEVWMEARPQ